MYGYFILVFYQKNKNYISFAHDACKNNNHSEYLLLRPKLEISLVTVATRVCSE